MTGSFLRASLFTSVVAYGVAALVIGLGVLFGLFGHALRSLSTVKIATSPAVERSQPSAPAKPSQAAAPSPAKA